MPSATPKTLTICLMLLAGLSAGCTTMRPVATDDAGGTIRGEIDPGDTVRVITKGGQTHVLKVTAVGATSLSGNALRTWEVSPDAVGSRIDVAYSDIAEFDVRRARSLNTGWLRNTALLTLFSIATSRQNQDGTNGTR